MHPPDPPMTPAELAEARTVMFWSRAALARLSGAAVNTVGRWLSGRAPVPPDVAAHIRAVVAFHRANARPTAEDDGAAVMLATELHAAAALIGWNALALARRTGIPQTAANRLWRSDAPVPPPNAGYIRRMAAWHAAHPWPKPPNKRKD